MGRITWSNCPVLVTGGRGMVGTQLVTALLVRNAKVTVLDDASRPGGQEVVGATYICGDAGDLQTVAPPVYQAAVIFNLAAQVAGVGYNQTHQLDMLTNNLRLQTVPLRATTHVQHPQVFVQTSSVCIYGAKEMCPATEDNAMGDAPVGANAGYAWAKRLGEIAAVLAATARLTTVIARPTNAYGPHDLTGESGHVIPGLLRQIFDPTANEIIVNGNGQEIREFIHCRDVADGLIALAEHGKNANAYNLGTNGTTAVPISLLVSLLCELSDCNKSIRYVQRFDSGDDRRWTSAQKAQIDCHWHYRIPLREGLAETISWYKSYLAAQCV